MHSIISIINVIFTLTRVPQVGHKYYKLDSKKIFTKKPSNKYNQICQGGASFVDVLVMCVSCMSVILSCLFLAEFWSTAGKGLTTWLSCL